MTADKRLPVALRAVVTALSEIQAPSMIIGGLAVIAAGIVRATRDVDATIRGRDSDVASVVHAFGRYGIVPDERRNFASAVQRGVLFLRHIATDIEVDIGFAWFPFEEEAIARAVDDEIEGVAVRVAVPEDLILYKGTAWRPLDQSDVGELLLRHLDTIDIDRVRALLLEIFAVLETPERLAEFDKLVERARHARR